MEKRISFYAFQNVVSVAKLIDPYLRQMEKAQTQHDKLVESISKLENKLKKSADELSKLQSEINSYEEGIVEHIGFHTTDLVQKVMVPTGKTTPEGKPAMTAEFKPTANVKYDEATKQFIVTLEEEPLGTPAETPVELLQQEADHSQLPWT